MVDLMQDEQGKRLEGFLKVDMGEHEFARFLRRNKAVDNWYAQGKSNVWVGPDGQAVAVCIYEGGLEHSYWVKESLV